MQEKLSRLRAALPHVSLRRASRTERAPASASPQAGTAPSTPPRADTLEAATAPAERPMAHTPLAQRFSPFQTRVSSTTHAADAIEQGATPKAAVTAAVKQKVQAYAERGAAWGLVHTNLTRHLQRKAPALAKTVDAAPAEVRQWIQEAVDDVVAELRGGKKRATAPQPGTWRLLGDDPRWRALQSAHAPQGESLATYRKSTLQKLTPQAPAGAAPRIDLDAVYARALEDARPLWNELQPKAATDVDTKHIERMFQAAVRSTKDGEDASRAREKLTKGASTVELLRSARKSKAARSKMHENLVDDLLMQRLGRTPGADPAFDARARDRAGRLLAGLAGTLASSEHAGVVEDPILDPKTHVDEHTWLQEKMAEVLSLLPLRITESGGFATLVRTMVGTALVKMMEQPESATLAQLDRAAFEGLQAGLYYGASYAFVDGLLDDPEALPGGSLSKAKAIADELESVLAGMPFSKAKGLQKLPQGKLIDEAVGALRALAGPQAELLFEDLAVLSRAQRFDKSVAPPDDEARYLPLIVKASRSYMAAATIAGRIDPAARAQLLRAGLWGQHVDDFRDVPEDRAHGSQTPFTNFLDDTPLDGKRAGARNPLADLFHASTLFAHGAPGEAGEARVGRSLLRVLHAARDLYGEPAFEDALARFSQGAPELEQLVRKGLKTTFTNDSEARGLRHLKHRSSDWARLNRQVPTFMADHLGDVQKLMEMPQPEDPEHQLLVNGMQHSLAAGGKRMRPMLVVLSSHMFGLPPEKTAALQRAVELLHTSSLILDDLPSQDDADTRRGAPALHKKDDDMPSARAEARADLASMTLVARAMRTISTDLAQHFPAEKVLEVIDYVAEAMEGLCVGQMKDLLSGHRPARDLSKPEEVQAVVDEIDLTEHMKTGLALEISLVPAAMLTNQPKEVIEQLKEFTRTIGVLFQLKDDILDHTSTAEELGKPVGIDEKNNITTWVKALGMDGAQARMQELQAKAHAQIDAMPMATSTLHGIVDYIVTRTK